MKVRIVHEAGMRFEAQTEKASFVIDCPQISPVEYFLSGLITCSASDIVMLPKAQGHEVRNLSVEGDAVRNESHPRKFNELDLLYRFDSDADDTTAARWVMASLETYCSTVNTVREGVSIRYTIVHNGKTIRDHEAMISGAGVSYDLGDIGGCPS